MSDDAPKVVGQKRLESELRRLEKQEMALVDAGKRVPDSLLLQILYRYRMLCTDIAAKMSFSEKIERLKAKMERPVEQKDISDAPTEVLDKISAWVEEGLDPRSTR